MPIETDASLPLPLFFTSHFTEARNLARRLGCAFIETSAKERINVDEAFIALVREIKRSQQVGSTLSRLAHSRFPISLGTHMHTYSASAAGRTSADRFTVSPSRDGFAQPGLWVQVYHSVEGEIPYARWLVKRLVDDGAHACVATATAAAGGAGAAPL